MNLPVTFLPLCECDFASHPNPIFRIMDQTTRNKIVSLVCDVLALGQETEHLPTTASVRCQPDVRAAAAKSPGLPGDAAPGGGDALDEIEP